MVAGEVISGKKKKKSINETPEIKISGEKDSFQPKELLKVLSKEIGTIVNELLNSLYDPNYAEKFADSIIIIYEKLKKEGISQEAIEKILLEYSRNVDKMISLIKKEGETSLAMKSDKDV